MHKYPHWGANSFPFISMFLDHVHFTACLFMQGWFTLKVVVIDDDNGLTADDPVDTFVVHQTLSSTSPTRKATFTGQRQTKPTTLDLSFTVHCDPNFYGARCSVYCQDTNSESGHCCWLNHLLTLCL